MWPYVASRIVERKSVALENPVAAAAMKSCVGMPHLPKSDQMRLLAVDGEKTVHVSLQSSESVRNGG